MKQTALFLFLVVNLLQVALPLTCQIGIGQRGKNYENGIGWTRKCKLTSKYCFEMVTLDVNQASKLFEYSWDSYYDQFYVRGCGGDYGTNGTWHPYKNLPKATRHKLGMVKANITTPKLITGQGGPENTVEMLLSYKCKTDLCEKVVYGNAAGQTARFSLLLTFLLSVSAAVATSIFF